MHPLLNVVVLAAVASGPDPVALATQAAQAYAAGDFTAAAARYRVALGVAPSAPGVLVGLGRSYARLGQTNDALEWLSRAADTGAGADAAAVASAFGTSSDSVEVRALSRASAAT